MNDRVSDIKNNKMFKKWDILIGVVIILVVIASIIMLTMPAGESVEIYLDGKKIETLSLKNDTTYIIDRDGVEMIIKIENGEVYVYESNCHNHICMNGTISKQGESIVCLPNKVVILITGEREVDAVT